MEAEPGRSLILWTVRVSVALYAVATWLYFRRHRKPLSAGRTYMTTWSAAWLLCVIHVICAFHFEHRWSHDAALAHTAEMTERVVGIYWSGGLYINYLFLTWWGIDAVRQFRRSAMSSSLTMHAVAAFMMFNATVVFGPRWWIIPVSVFALLLLRSRNSKHETAD